MAATSLEAYFSLSPKFELQPKEQRIIDLFEAGLKNGRPLQLSRQQISSIIGMPINGVCGRVDSLLTKNVLVERGERKDPITGKAQKLLMLPVIEQLELGLQ